MTEKWGGLYKAFAWFSTRKWAGKNGDIHFQPSNPTGFDEAMERAREVGGWVEKDGEPAHVEDDSQST